MADAVRSIRSALRPGSWVYPVAIAVVVAVAGMTLNPYLLFLLTRVVIFSMLVVGLNVLMGYSGLLSFAHAALFGIGAYVTGLMQVHLGVPYAVALLTATVGVTGVGTLLVLPALRLSGIHLAIATLAVAQAVHWVLINWSAVTFGAGGFRAPSITIFSLNATQSIFLTSLVLTTIGYLMVRQLLRTSFGRKFVAIRDNSVAAAANGVNVTATKTIAFALSAGLAGLAGGLYSALLGYVAPESFNLEQMILMKVMAVVGGLGTMLGSVIGPALVIFLQEQLRDSQGWLEIIFGAVLIGFVLFMPKGIAPLIYRVLGGKRAETVETGPRTGQKLGQSAPADRAMEN